MSLEKEIREKYQFVLVRRPYNLMKFTEVALLFPKIIQLKALGYQQEYDQHVLPYDTSDFIASHLLLCEKSSKGPVPVLAFKSVTLSLCDAHRVPFPMLGMLDNEGPNESYKSPFLKRMDNYRRQKDSHNLAYNGSFTIHPHLRENKELMKHLWDITFSLLTNYYIEYEINHVVAICATKFNVHLKKERLGWNFIKTESGVLAPYNCHTLFGASFIPMELVDVKEKGQESASKFKDMWLERITLDEEHLEKQKSAA